MRFSLVLAHLLFFIIVHIRGGEWIMEALIKLLGSQHQGLHSENSEETH